ncbi:hypothetical protein ACA910_016042 [Epithemia clementina (nom. ined.)]
MSSAFASLLESNPDRVGTTLFLDPAIRDWVVLPLFVVMVVAGLLRGLVGRYLAGPYEKSKAVGVRCQNQFNRLNKIRSGASHFISTTRWHIRRLFAIQELTDQADWCIDQHEKKQAEKETMGAGGDDPLSAMMNPMDMLKGNMVFMVQNMVMMQGIQYFFSGFIMLKIPFALTSGFKAMFQKGLADSMPDLDPSYVSSISWYFLTMYGLRGFFKLVMGGEPLLEIREQEMALKQLGMAPPPANPQSKQNDLEEWATKFQKEAENFELFVTSHQSDFDQVEKRLLGAKYPKRKSSKGASFKGGINNSDFLLGKVKRKTQ